MAMIKRRDFLKFSLMGAGLFSTGLYSCANSSSKGQTAEFNNVYHVSVDGNDGNDGSRSNPFKTIMAASAVAKPGDAITVHEGTYRERINPVRGGISDQKRITYQAAQGEKVVIKGSEVITGWEKVNGDTWKVVIPNSFFGDFNPYSDIIYGDWFYDMGRKHHTGAVYINEHWLTEAAHRDEVLNPADADTPLWFAEVDPNETTIWAHFDVNPNQVETEINVRQAIFYPEKTGVNYLTVRGFTMMHAATPWAPPTAEQIGLIGTNWSKGWIIENNDIKYATCVAVTLGKYGDEWDNKSEDSAEGYVMTIERALENGWSKDKIGSHVVRNNHISHCEQAGIVGSLGAVFSSITGNEIHDIHIRRLFGGHEMSGIKIHGAVDFLIEDNHIYRTYRGIWMDWMTQGARITRNLFYDNGPEQDLYFEVNHGPFVVDNNLFLSERALKDRSQGGVYAHNLIAGSMKFWPELYRETPYLQPHSTEIKGFDNHPGGDSHYYNNIFVGTKLDIYDDAEQPMHMVGNVYLADGKPSKHDEGAVVLPDFKPDVTLVQETNKVKLQMRMESSFTTESTTPVTSDRVGETLISGEPYLDHDGNPLKIDTDYLKVTRNVNRPAAGAFEKVADGKNTFTVWERKG